MSVKEHTAYQNTKYEYHFYTLSYLFYYMYFVRVNVLECMLIITIRGASNFGNWWFYIWVILQLHVECLNYLKLGDGDNWYIEIDFYPAQNIIPIARVNKWS